MLSAAGVQWGCHPEAFLKGKKAKFRVTGA